MCQNLALTVLYVAWQVDQQSQRFQHFRESQDVDDRDRGGHSWEPSDIRHEQPFLYGQGRGLEGRDDESRPDARPEYAQHGGRDQGYHGHVQNLHESESAGPASGRLDGPASGEKKESRGLIDGPASEPRRWEQPASGAKSPREAVYTPAVLGGYQLIAGPMAPMPKSMAPASAESLPEKSEAVYTPAVLGVNPKP